MGKEFLTCCVALDQCLKLPDLQFLHHKNESIMSEQQISNVCPFKSQGLVNKPISLASTPGFSLNIACMRPRNLYLSDTPPPTTNTHTAPRCVIQPSLWGHCLKDPMFCARHHPYKREMAETLNTQIAISFLPVSIYIFPL